MVMPGWSLDLSEHPELAEIARFFPTSMAADAFRFSRSKSELFSRLAGGNASVNANLPPFVLYDFDRDSASERDLSALPLPLFIKLDRALARHRGPDAVMRVTSVAEAQRRLELLARDYRMALVQGYVPSRGVGAFVLRWNGRSIARMMHMRLHEMPHTGGASSLRCTWWQKK